MPPTNDVKTQREEEITVNVDCLEHSLTEVERMHFEENGFLFVEDALYPDQIDQLTAAIDRLHREAIEADQTEPGKPWGKANLLGQDGAFLNLVDNPTVLPKVWGIMGWNIFSYHTHLHVKPPAAEKVDESEGWMEWHRDSGQVNKDIRVHPPARLSLKVAYFLTDVSEPGRGNFHVIPGSNLSDEMPEFSEVGRDPQERRATSVPENALPICAKPGTAVFFDRRTVHARSSNISDITRKALFYGYGHRWISPKDPMDVDHVIENCDPIRRQLLGYTTSPNGQYVPKDEDVPLRGWLEQHAPEEMLV